MKAIVQIDNDALHEFCKRWPIHELDLFGPALRDDFAPDSDLDFLVVYAPGAKITLLDEVEMQAELEALCGRPVERIALVWPLTKEVASPNGRFDVERRLRRDITRVIRRGCHADDGPQ